ncbi:MAG: hypothetical protein R3F15_17855 [Lysobacterales bacterium]
MSAPLQQIEFEGRDAQTFLQAQLATDLRELADGHWCWAALLSLKGRVLSLGPLGRLSATHWSWLLPADLAETIANHLSRYRLRSKLTIAVTDVGIQAQSQTGAESAGTLTNTGAGALNWNGFAAGWCLHQSVGQTPPSPDSWTECTLARLRQGRPLISAASSDQHLPAALGLLDDGTVSVRKGCYPGQEIVARTHFLGRNKRSRCLLRGDLPVPAIGDSIHAAERQVGEIVESAFAEPGWLALAVAEAAALDGSPLHINGLPVDVVESFAG